MALVLRCFQRNAVKLCLFDAVGRNALSRQGQPMSSIIAVPLRGTRNSIENSEEPWRSLGLQSEWERLMYRARVRWCNGSTRPFGGFCHGSNPCRTAKSAVGTPYFARVHKTIHGKTKTRPSEEERVVRNRLPVAG